MYFAMDDLGLDSLEAIRQLPTAGEKWRRIDALAREAGFEGLHLSPSLYTERLGLSLAALPDYVQRYRLSYHPGGLYDLTASDGHALLTARLSEALSWARQNRMEDVSIHPPYLPEGMQPARGYVRERFAEILYEWLPKFHWAGITLSLESHVNGAFFVFQGLADYASFVLDLRMLGALIALSHNSYDGYSENDLLALIRPLPVTGFHIGDTDASKAREAGTHLPVGQGTVGLRRLLTPYLKAPNLYGALEINGSYEDIYFSLEKLRLYRQKA